MEYFLTSGIKYLLKVFILFDLGPETRPHVIMKTWDFENFESPQVQMRVSSYCEVISRSFGGWPMAEIRDKIGSIYFFY